MPTPSYNLSLDSFTIYNTRSFIAGSFALVACAPAPVAPVLAPVPAAVRLVATAPSTAPAVTLSEAPAGWHRFDQSADHIAGISVDRAMHEVVAGRAAKQNVLVAIIDGGIDTAHVDLRPHLWVNPKKIRAKGRDDDRNGYVDDVHGWNFIGGHDGRDVFFDTWEVTREYARCHHRAAAAGEPAYTDAAKCTSLDSAFDKVRKTVESEVAEVHQVIEMLQQLRQALGTDSLTEGAVRALNPPTAQLTQARQVYLNLAAHGMTPSRIEYARTIVEGQLKYGFNPDYDSRTIVGDVYTDPNQRHYGNNDVMGQDASHGTHVAGIIGAVRDTVAGVGGIAQSVTFMMIRAAPMGDERDKDIANAIRYAVDNGAKVISMSFGKAYSPYKSVVDDAVRYADAHGVLMVHGAGNDGQNLDTAQNFPTPVYLGGGRSALWIEVGASSWQGGNHLVAPFSNYSKNLVDVFAPGVDILSTVPGNKYERDSGTSMAAPVVTGLAALIMSYYPNLSAADVKKIILDSATRYDQSVFQPGSGDKTTVMFSSLSVTGGIVNAYNALKMAEAMTSRRVQP